MLLRKGEYQITGTLRISVGGVVLRGEGRERDGTVIMATGTGRRTLIEVNAVLWRLEEHRSVRVSRGKAWREVPGTRRAITDAYVPVGARTFHVESTRGLAAGDRIIVHRPSTSAWISAIGMDRIPPRPGRVTRQWQAGQYDLRFDRVITRIRDTEVTIDAPLVNAIEQEFGGGWIYEYTFPERIAQVGVENLRAESHFNGWPDDEDHAWNFILLDAVENAWVRNVTGVHFAYSCVYVERHGKWITVEDAACLDPVSKIASPRRYPLRAPGAAHPGPARRLERRTARLRHALAGAGPQRLSRLPLPRRPQRQRPPSPMGHRHAVRQRPRCRATPSTCATAATWAPATDGPAPR